MTIDTYSFAMLGLTPNANHISIANFGLLNIEISITPQYAGGGGFGPPISYNISIKVSYKKNKWDKSWIVRRAIGVSLYAKLINTVVDNIINIIKTVFKSKQQIKISGKIKDGTNKTESKF